MGRGFRYYEPGLGTSILWIYVFLAVGIVILFLILEYQKKSSPQYRELMKVVNNRYSKGEILEEEYYEIKSVLEDEYSKNTAVMKLNLQYAHGNISLEDYYDKLNNIM